MKHELTDRNCAQVTPKELTEAFYRYAPNVKFVSGIVERISKKSDDNHGGSTAESDKQTQRMTVTIRKAEEQSKVFDLSADIVIIAAGAWSSSVCQKIDL